MVGSRRGMVGPRREFTALISPQMTETETLGTRVRSYYYLRMLTPVARVPDAVAALRSIATATDLIHTGTWRLSLRR